MAFVKEQAHKSSEDTQVAGYAQFEKVWARKGAVHILRQPGEGITGQFGAPMVA